MARPMPFTSKNCTESGLSDRVTCPQGRYQADILRWSARHVKIHCGGIAAAEDDGDALAGRGRIGS
jgi:hypothetical protein